MKRILNYFDWLIPRYARKPLLAAPMVASYCIVSVILGRVFLKEKLKPGQVACVIGVIIGIVLLGISDGLAEA